MICIVCPVGCHLSIDTDSHEVANNKCKRGERYAQKELLDPTRMVTSTVSIDSIHQRRVPVKTTDAIPKGKIFDLMDLLETIDLKVPTDLGEVVIANVFDTGVDVVTTMSLHD